MVADIKGIHVTEPTNSPRSSLTSDDVRTIIRDELRHFDGSLAKLVDALSMESLERKQDNRRITDAIGTVTKAVADFAGNMDVMHQRCNYIEKSQVEGHTHIYRLLNECENRVRDLEINQAENRKHLNIAWSIAGSLAVLVVTVAMSFGSDFTTTLQGMTDAMNSLVEFNKLERK